MFVRNRAIVPIVWTQEAETQATHEYGGHEFPNYPLEYWVRYVAELGGTESALILVQNKCDSASQEAVLPPVDPALLQGFGFIKVGVHYSAKNARGHDTLLDSLRQASIWIRETFGLTEIGRGRARVKRQLEDMRDAAQDQPSERRQNRWITREQFAALCEEAGDISDTNALLDYLHQIGTVFSREDLFDGHVVIDQQWALDAIYAVFHRESGLYKRIRERQLGRFTRSDLASGLWNELGHSASAQKLFLSMMRSCGICFTLRNTLEADDVEYVAPDLLPDRERVFLELVQKWDEDADIVGAAFTYAFLAPVLVRTLMAEIGEMFGQAADYWADGFYLFEARSQARALVEVEKDQGGWGGTLRLRAQRGDAAALLRALTARVERINDRFALEPTNVEKPASGTRERPSVARTVGDQSDIDLRDQAALEPAYERTRSNKRYVSYAWGGDLDSADRQRAEAIERLCQRAEAQGVEIIRDRNVLQFGDGIYRFMDQLAASDRVWVILSAKYLQSSYCMYELFKIYQNTLMQEEVFRARIRVVKLPDADISSLSARVGHAEYWDRLFKERNAVIGRRPDLVGVSDFREFKLVREFAHHIGEMLKVIDSTFNPQGIDEIDQIDFCA